MTRPAPVVALALFFHAALPAAQDVPPLRFEVVSVKPNHSGDQGPRNLSPVPGGVRVTNMPLFTIIWIAHRVQADQVVDAPAWSKSESFDIVGKTSGPVGMSMDTIGALLRDVLAERFQLKAHREQRELPVYALVRLKAAGTLGPRMKPAETDCVAASSGRAAPPQPGALMRCGATARPGGVMVHGFALNALTGLLGPATGRIVVDRTGLTGAWDVDLDFSPEQGGTPSTGPAALAPAGPTTDAPSLFTALQEQLGLKLESSRAAVDVLVIDRLERPTPD